LPDKGNRGEPRKRRKKGRGPPLSPEASLSLGGIV